MNYMPDQLPNPSRYSQALQGLRDIIKLSDPKDVQKAIKTLYDELVSPIEEWRVCVQCGNLFIPSRPWSKYCKKECYNLFYKLLERSKKAGKFNG